MDNWQLPDPPDDWPQFPREQVILGPQTHATLIAISKSAMWRLERANDKIRRVEALLEQYEADDQEHLNTFGQHHPYAGWAADHLREALTGEA